MIETGKALALFNGRYPPMPNQHVHMECSKDECISWVE